jgi:hypothetical protein
MAQVDLSNFPADISCRIEKLQALASGLRASWRATLKDFLGGNS